MENPRKCKQCLISKSLLDFYPTRLECKECSKTNQREYRKINGEVIRKRTVKNRTNNKKEFVNLHNNMCADCKISYPLPVYDLHHLDPKEKEYTPGHMFSRTFENAKEELDKCILLCANCHRLRHYYERLEFQYGRME